ncbi:MAG: hypothetical protein JF606_26245 [Burkholderiales bacterium]|nr:hypothetical protein [Burkholderiales bacterium]
MTSASRKLKAATEHRNALLQNAVSLASHGAKYLRASGRPNVEQSDKYKDFALSIHRERGVYGITRSSLTEHLKGEIERALSSTLKFKFESDSEAVKSHYDKLASSPLPEAVLSSLNAVIHQCSTADGTFHELMDEDESAPERDFESKLLMCELFWADFSRLGSTIDRFNVAAAGAGRSDADASEQWGVALDFVKAVGRFAAGMSEAMDVLFEKESKLALGRTEINAAKIAEDDWGIVLKDKQPALQTRGESSRSARRRSRPNRTTRSDTAASSSGNEAAKEVIRSTLLEKADDALRPRQLTSALAESCSDPLAIAKTLGKDTSVIETMEANGADPLSVANNLRASAQSWFGNSGFVRRVRDALAPLAKANPDDEVIGNKVRQLDERIEVLRVIDGYLQARASDSLKRHEFPKAQHLRKLLKLDQIAGISAPVRLPSAGDQGELGTLFELKITPRPFSDGKEAPAVYLHLHTLLPVSPRQCLALPFADLAAAHTKSEEQRSLGSRWEELQQLCGNTDARVHRGPVDQNLLGVLLQRARDSLR